MSDEQTQRAPGSAGATTEEVSLLDAITAETRIKPTNESYPQVKRGVEVLLGELLKPKHAKERIDKALVDALIAEIDAKMSAQLDEILHHPTFQKIESAWTGLKLLVDRTNFRENVKIEILNVSKEDLLADFEDSPEIPKSGLYKQIYKRDYGQFGGQPTGAIVGNYTFGPGPQDVKLMQNVAAVATMSHAPFIAGAAPEFFGLDEFAGLPNMKDLEGRLRGSAVHEMAFVPRERRRPLRGAHPAALPRAACRTGPRPCR